MPSTTNTLFQQTSPYWDFLRLEKQVSPHTLKNYQRQLFAVCELLDYQQVQSWLDVDSCLSLTNLMNVTTVRFLV